MTTNATVSRNARGLYCAAVGHDVAATSPDPEKLGRAMHALDLFPHVCDRSVSSAAWISVRRGYTHPYLLFGRCGGLEWVSPERVMAALEQLGLAASRHNPCAVPAARWLAEYLAANGELERLAALLNARDAYQAEILLKAPHLPAAAAAIARSRIAKAKADEALEEIKTWHQ